MIRWLIDQNVALSKRIDSALWSSMMEDGNRSFIRKVREVVKDGASVADVGGGKTPLFSPEDVRAKGLTVTGVDIDPVELADAPGGAYERTICADITSFRGDEHADFVVVQSLLEHVSDNRSGLAGIASLCKPGGVVLTFCPNRRAWFAVINRLLPEWMKRKILFFIFPKSKDLQGFRAYYDRCTPKDLSDAMREAGLKVESVEPFFVSTYFMFFFPFHVAWRVFTAPLMRVWPLVFCETFVIRASKPANSACDGPFD